MAIQDILNKILSEPLIKNMRQYMVDGINQVYKDATAKGDTNMEVLRARGSSASLNDRLEDNENQIAQKATKTALNATDSRIDTLLALPDGATNIDARLEDIKVGVNGEIYASPGESIRTQLEGKVSFVQLNNIAPNQDFSTSENVINVNASIDAIANNELQFTTTATYGQIYELVTLKANNVYYVGTKFKNNGKTSYLDVYTSTGEQLAIKTHSGSGNYELLDLIVSAPVEKTARLRLLDPRAGYVSSVKEMVFINLTEVYGKGNEPTLTDFKEILNILTYGESFFKNNNVEAFSNAMSKSSLSKPKGNYYVHIKENELIVIQKYNATSDIKFIWKKTYPNNIFNLSSISLINNSLEDVSNDYSNGAVIGSFGTDTLGPFLMKAINNANGDKPLSNQFTGGSHGYNNDYVVAPTNTPTGRSADLLFKIDGRSVSLFSGYCNKIEVFWSNYIQGFNTIKADGTGREIAKESYHLTFIGNEIKTENTIQFLEETNVTSYYGLQFPTPSMFKQTVFYKTGSNNFNNDANIDSNSGNQECDSIVMKKNNDIIEMELDVTSGLGKNKLLDVVEYNAFTTSYGKAYFYLIENQVFEANEILTFKGNYKFYGN